MALELNGEGFEHPNPLGFAIAFICRIISSWPRKSQDTTPMYRIHYNRDNGRSAAMTRK